MYDKLILNDCGKKLHKVVKLMKRTKRSGNMAIPSNSDTFKMQKKSPQQYLDERISFANRALIGSAISVAYQNVVEYMHKSPDFLKTQHAQKLLPEIKNMAVEYTLIQACNNGIIPLTWSVEQNTNRSGCFVELKSDDNGCVFTINQTKSRGTKSRKAKLREDLDDVFQSKLILFSSDAEAVNNSIINERPLYFEINHGYQSTEPLFAVVGRPNLDAGWEMQYSLLNQVQLLSKGESNDIKTAAHDLEDFSNSDFEEYAGLNVNKE
ncbi:hypothetical protein [Levilactobacillus brevis]|uniref:hypothetical protein n=2 Tax=Levilactobacillus brevis TaxID=1580 RepID=UPI00117B4185|nr:hypothetical protein [Levilactobacillus brevis]